MTRITLWAAWDRKDKAFAHNHFEDGWVAGLAPKPIKPEFTDQVKSWPKQTWQKSYGYIDKDQKVVTCLTFKNTSHVSKT